MADSEENKSETFGYVSNWTVLFGKHKNTKFKDVPSDYLGWCYHTSAACVTKMKRSQGIWKRGLAIDR